MERLYRLILRCYPGEFRDEYEREMLQAFRDRLGDDRRHGAGAVLRLLWQVALDAVLRAPSEHLDVLRQDVRYALRSLRRAPVFFVTAVATLALGAGANAAIFSVIHAVALRPLPYDAEGRLIRVWEDNQGLAITGFAVAHPNYLSWKERARTVDLAEWMGGSVTLLGSGDPVHIRSLSVSASFLPIMGVTPVEGRLFTTEDEARNGAPVAIITNSVWQNQFGGDRSILGKAVKAGDTSPVIVGIIPDDSFPTRGEFLVPLRGSEELDDRTDHLSQVIGRLRPGFTIEQARADLEDIARQLSVEYPASNHGWGVTIESAYDWLLPSTTRRALYVILGAVGCVLLIACANVANLMLARGAARKREIALRMAIGAARRRLVRQVLTEGLLLTVFGAAAGVALAYWMMPMLRSWLPESLQRAQDAAVNMPVLVFALATCMLTGVAFTVVPALAGSSADTMDSLKDGARGSTGTATHARHVLATLQIALATILLVGAGLLIQSLQRLQRVELGFDPAGVTTAMMGLPNERYKGPDLKWAFYKRLLERLGSAPGVEAAALTSGAPFDGGNTGAPIEAVGTSRLEGKPLQADWRMVSPGYFKALRVRLLKGELFTGNGKADEFSLIVSATMARRIWGDEDPIGRQVTAGPTGTFRIVGVVDDVRHLELALEPAPTMYISTARYTWPAMTVVVRSSAGQPSAAGLIRSTLRELDPQLALFNVRQLVDGIDQNAAQPRLNAILVGVFALLAALLAALGIYGVLAYLVSQRRQEIGIRMALGAGRPSVQGLFIRRGLWLAAAGVTIGVTGALIVARWISSLMFGVSARDPLTIAVAVTFVAVVALLASYIPAWKAARVDPLVALRAE